MPEQYTPRTAYMFAVRFPPNDPFTPNKVRLVMYRTEKKARQYVAYYRSWGCFIMRLTKKQIVSEGE